MVQSEGSSISVIQNHMGNESPNARAVAVFHCASHIPESLRDLVPIKSFIRA